MRKNGVDEHKLERQISLLFILAFLRQCRINKVQHNNTSKNTYHAAASTLSRAGARSAHGSMSNINVAESEHRSSVLSSGSRV